MTKKLILIMLIFFIIPISLATEVCEERIVSGDNCTLITPTLTCTSGYTYDIYNNETIILSNEVLTSIGGNIYTLTFNQTNRGVYLVKLCDGTTREIIVGGKDEMSSVSISLFIIISSLGFIITPLLVRFSPFEITNMIIKRGMISIGIYLMALNSVIMATIAAQAGLTITKEMFAYMTIFGWLGYISIITLVITTIIQIMKIMKERRISTRMGEEYDY